MRQSHPALWWGSNPSVGVEVEVDPGLFRFYYNHSRPEMYEGRKDLATTLSSRGARLAKEVGKGLALIHMQLVTHDEHTPVTRLRSGMAPSLAEFQAMAKASAEGGAKDKDASSSSAAAWAMSVLLPHKARGSAQEEEGKGEGQGAEEEEEAEGSSFFSSLNLSVEVLGTVNAQPLLEWLKLCVDQTLHDYFIERLLAGVNHRLPVLQHGGTPPPADSSSSSSSSVVIKPLVDDLLSGAMGLDSPSVRRYEALEVMPRPLTELAPPALLLSVSLGYVHPHFTAGQQALFTRTQDGGLAELPVTSLLLDAASSPAPDPQAAHRLPEVLVLCGLRIGPQQPPPSSASLLPSVASSPSLGGPESPPLRALGQLRLSGGGKASSTSSLATAAAGGGSSGLSGEGGWQHTLGPGDVLYPHLTTAEGASSELVALHCTVREALAVVRVTPDAQQLVVYNCHPDLHARCVAAFERALALVAVQRLAIEALGLHKLGLLPLDLPWWRHVPGLAALIDAKAGNTAMSSLALTRVKDATTGAGGGGGELSKEGSVGGGGGGAVLLTRSGSADLSTVLGSGGGGGGGARPAESGKGGGGGGELAEPRRGLLGSGASRHQEAMAATTNEEAAAPADAAPTRPGASMGATTSSAGGGSSSSGSATASGSAGGGSAGGVASSMSLLKKGAAPVGHSSKPSGGGGEGGSGSVVMTPAMAARLRASGRAGPPQAKRKGVIGPPSLQPSSSSSSGATTTAMQQQQQASAAGGATPATTTGSATAPNSTSSNTTTSSSSGGSAPGSASTSSNASTPATSKATAAALAGGSGASSSGPPSTTTTSSSSQQQQVGPQSSSSAPSSSASSSSAPRESSSSSVLSRSQPPVDEAVARAKALERSLQSAVQWMVGLVHFGQQPWVRRLSRALVDLAPALQPPPDPPSSPSMAGDGEPPVLDMNAVSVLSGVLMLHEAPIAGGLQLSLARSTVIPGADLLWRQHALRLWLGPLEFLHMLATRLRVRGLVQHWLWREAALSAQQRAEQQLRARLTKPLDLKAVTATSRAADSEQASGHSRGSATASSAPPSVVLLGQEDLSAILRLCRWQGCWSIPILLPVTTVHLPVLVRALDFPLLLERRQPPAAMLRPASPPPATTTSGGEGSKAPEAQQGPNAVDGGAKPASSDGSSSKAATAAADQPASSSDSASPVLPPPSSSSGLTVQTSSVSSVSTPPHVALKSTALRSGASIERSHLELAGDLMGRYLGYLTRTRRWQLLHVPPPSDGSGPSSSLAEGAVLHASMLLTAGAPSWPLRAYLTRPVPGADSMLVLEVRCSRRHSLAHCPSAPSLETFSMTVTLFTLDLPHPPPTTPNGPSLVTAHAFTWPSRMRLQQHGSSSRQVLPRTPVLLPVEVSGLSAELQLERHVYEVTLERTIDFLQAASGQPGSTSFLLHLLRTLLRRYPEPPRYRHIPTHPHTHSAKPQHIAAA